MNEIGACVCNSIPALVIADPAKHGYSESISVLQTSS